jgi:hypothetical protein
MKTLLSTPARKLYMVLSPHALNYASAALTSLFANSAERLDLHLITDSDADKRALVSALHALSLAPHTVAVVSQNDLAAAEASLFSQFPNLRAFRNGHPCWRKITDPLLLAAPGEEIVVLDPDLYFPNRFTFEPTPTQSLRLMWQQPNCLLPSTVVRTALTAGISLARHVDIGVAQWHRSHDSADLEWLDRLLGRLGGTSLPRVPHVEAIVWSAMAMRFGGGHLDPRSWVCWRRTQRKRILRKLGVDGISLLRSEPFSEMKCFHAGGEAKAWLTELAASRASAPATSHLHPTPVLPFVELTSSRFEREQAARNLMAGLGYHRLFGAGRS